MDGRVVMRKKRTESDNRCKQNSETKKEKTTECFDLKC